MTWARWTGKWHFASTAHPRRALCGYSLGLVVAEHGAPPRTLRCERCTSLRRI